MIALKSKKKILLIENYDETSIKLRRLMPGIRIETTSYEDDLEAIENDLELDVDLESKENDLGLEVEIKSEEANNKKDEVFVEEVEDDVRIIPYRKSAKKIISFKKREKIVFNLVNDENNVIYDTITVPNSLKKKHVNKITTEFINKNYFNLDKKEYVLETSKLKEQGEKTIYLIKLIRKSFMQSFYELERIHGFLTDIELIKDETFDDEDVLLINESHSHLLIYGFNNIGLMFFHKIKKGDDDLSKVNEYVKQLFFEHSFRVKKIMILSDANAQMVDGLKDETGIQNIEIDKGYIDYKILSLKKIPKNQIYKKLNRNVYSEITIFGIALLCVIQAFSYTMNKHLDKKSDELQGVRSSVTSSINQKQSQKDSLRWEIDELIHKNYNHEALLAGEFNSNKSRLLFKINKLMPVDMVLDKVYMDEYDQLILGGRSTNYSNIGFFAKKLEYASENVSNINVEGEPKEVRFKITIEDRGGEYDEEYDHEK